ncbi:MAG: TadE/TadG family type IV pilus assembly protein [Polyangiales bacterium]
MRELRADSRGAVMVIAVFMSAFMCGILWYVIGVGDAVIYRESMQDGADAVAFGTAVDLARSMNVLVLINQVMAAVLAVLLAFKVVQVALGIANATLLAICAWPFGGEWACVPAEELTEVEEPYSNTVDDVKNIVDMTLEVLHGAEEVLEYSLPLLAEADGITIANNYGTTVKSGLPVSDSLAGLPVEFDDFSVLCDHAADDVPGILLLPIGVIVIEGAPLGAPFVAAASLGTLPLARYMCDDGSGSGAASAASTYDSASKGSIAGAGGTGVLSPKDACSKDATDCAAGTFPPNPDCSKYTKSITAPDGTSSTVFDTAGCTDAKMKAAGMVDPASYSGTSASNKSPVRVKSSCKAGDTCFAVWSMVNGDIKNNSGAYKGVNIASWGGEKAGDSTTLGNQHFAMAEFFYEPSSSASWDSIKADAMWKMRWKARLRRFRLPMFGDVALIIH